MSKAKDGERICIDRKSGIFCKKNKNYPPKIFVLLQLFLLVMAKYWEKQIFTHGSGSKAKDGEKKRERERAKVGNNNGQLRIAMPPRVAHAKLPGPKLAS